MANQYGMGRSMVYQWFHEYNSRGESAFDYSSKNKKYSIDLKKAAINDYLEGLGSLKAIANKYEISAHTILRKWVMKYNSHIEITDYDPKPEVYMAKSRKTTQEKRIEVVKYCLNNNKNYKDTAIKFGVNYVQVYTWVKKYKEHGEDGLLDRRGHNKLVLEMTEEEKLSYNLKKLKAKNSYLEMENKALKKLEEIERRMARGKLRK